MHTSYHHSQVIGGRKQKKEKKEKKENRKIKANPKEE